MSNDLMSEKKYQQGVVYSLIDYHPYRKLGEDNPDRDRNTYKMMDLKNSEHPNHQSAVNHFGAMFDAGTHRLLEFLGTDKIQVAIVPSSKVGKQSKGLEGVLAHVKDVELLYNPNFLVRTVDIQSSHEGGQRSVVEHLRTIAVKVAPDPSLPMILLDDVKTTGASLDACKQLLEAVGIREIYMVALGNTV
ncbi:TPA: hypothetical protein NJ576_003838 [Vibrio parahaemolyticus]|nr:hypothetical protein [Vibrio parahaemolyticus]